MTKPTKTQLIKQREDSYREQTLECCGTCKHFGRLFISRLISRCYAIELRGNVVRKDVGYLGICDLYEQQKDGDT